MNERTTGGRDELSRALRQLRHAAGLSGTEAGRLAGFSQAKVSRIENGVNVPTPDDVAILVKVYSASAQDRRRLEAMARDVRAEYRRVVLVKTRMTRQQLLHDPGHRFTLITTAGALAWRAGTPEQMAAQIEHIAESTRLPNARVGIIPWGAQARVFPLHGWDLYDRRAVIVGTANATAVLTEPIDVTVYADLFTQMEHLAVFDDQARSVLTRLADEYRNLA